MKIILLLLIVLCYTTEALSFKSVLKKTGKILKTIGIETFRGLKNGPIPSKPDWAKETITSAEYVVRDKQGEFMHRSPIKHHGITFETAEGNSWLLHNTPGKGPVVTDASGMSSKWETLHEIPVNGHKTVGGALRSAGFSLSGGKKCSYIEGKTCIGTAHSAENYLEK